MSWQIQLSGHSTNDEAEAQRVNDLAKEMVTQARKLGLNPTYGHTSTNGKNLSSQELLATDES